MRRWMRNPDRRRVNRENPSKTSTGPAATTPTSHATATTLLLSRASRTRCRCGVRRMSRQVRIPPCIPSHPIRPPQSLVPFILIFQTSESETNVSPPHPFGVSDINRGNLPRAKHLPQRRRAHPRRRADPERRPERHARVALCPQPAGQEALGGRSQQQEHGGSSLLPNSRRRRCQQQSRDALTLAVLLPQRSLLR